MDDVTRRTLLAATAAGGILAAAKPPARRPTSRCRNRSGPDMAAPIPVRATSSATGRIPTCWCRRPPITARCPICASPSPTPICGWRSGGWTRQVTVRELGISKDIAGVNMRLNAGGVRELHWHKAAEWAYMLYGTRPHHRHRSAGAATSSMTSASAISGIFRPAFRIRSRASIRTAANSCWCSTTAISTKTILSC